MQTARVVPAEALHLMRRGATVTEATLAVQRSNLSSRRRVMREANRRGKWFGIVSRMHVRGPIRVFEAVFLAVESARGNDVYDHCAVPERWLPVFVRIFTKSAVYAAHTTRDVSAKSA